VLVAHPDDEALWAGGFILGHPGWHWFVGTLCRASDPDRAPRFRRALERYGAEGAMADLDDGPEQKPLRDQDIGAALLGILPRRHFDLVLTHGPLGEYTRHRRHEEVSRVVSALWRGGELVARELWLFAYEDGGGAYLPRPRQDADYVEMLPRAILEAKRELVTGVYGFAPDSWEGRVVPEAEAFYCLRNGQALPERLLQKGCL